MEDQLNWGLPTDRLLVEWDLRASPPTIDRTRGAAVPLIVVDDSRPVAATEEPGSPLLVQVPPDMRVLRRSDPETARAWRMAQRHALQWAFAHGYVVRDFEAGAYVLSAGGT